MLIVIMAIVVSYLIGRYIKDKIWRNGLQASLAIGLFFFLFYNPVDFKNKPLVSFDNILFLIIIGGFLYAKCRDLKQEQIS